MSRRSVACWWCACALVSAALLLSGCSRSFSPDSWTGTAFAGVWGSADGVVFAVGQHDAYVYQDASSTPHFPGHVFNRWQRVPTGSRLATTAIWGSSARDVFVVGSNDVQGTIVHFDGDRWTTQLDPAPGGLVSVWGSSGSDVYAVGPRGVVLHYDGSTWTSLPRLHGGRSVWGSSGHDVYVVGGIRDTIDHFDGTSWSRRVLPSGVGNCMAVWGSSDHDVFVLGSQRIAHFDGTRWSLQRSHVDVTLYAIWGSSGQDVFAVGDAGQVVHYDGRTWSPQVGAGLVHLSALWGSSDRNVFAVGDDGIQRWDGTRWGRVLGAAR